jgi:hypothetical protein
MRTTLKQHHFSFYRNGTPESHSSGVLKNHAGANCSAVNPAPERNSGLKRTWKEDIFKKFYMKTNSNSK